MKSIGGYFGIEISMKSEFHTNMIRLNSGRYALEYILIAKKIKKLYMPYFTCDVLLEPLHRNAIEYEFYKVNEVFEPIFDFSKIEESELFLFTNYFGIKDKYVRELAKKSKNLIIDNSQSFYSIPLEGIDTIYSPRKFFGVSDGAYLYTSSKLNKVLEQDISYNRFDHLLARPDISAEFGYELFLKNDKSLENNEIKIMSSLTQDILKSIDYESVATIRRNNFQYLHNALKEKNSIKFDLDEKYVPMVYPFWTNDRTLRKRLLENKIYTATYWPNVLKWREEGTLEFKMVNEIIYLPIDQRYSEIEMNMILKLI